MINGDPPEWPCPVPGQTCTVLVLGHGENAAAVVTEVRATLTSETGPRRFLPAGPTSIDERTLNHYEDTLVPLLRAIAESLDMDLPHFRISFSNLNVSASQDRGVHIAGFSADVAVFLACLSAFLKIPTLPGIVATGHIASVDAGIRMVKNLPAKIRAVCRSRNSTTLLYPDLDTDDSLAVLTPDEHTAIHEAIISGQDHVKLKAVGTVDQLLKAAFSESDLVVGSLHHDYFSDGASLGSVAPGVQVLKGNLAARFWFSLEASCHRYDNATIRNILEARVQYQLRIQAYPQGFGRQLYHLIAALPPSTRTIHIRFPVLRPEDALSMVRLAAPSDLNDLRQFLDAVSGDHFSATLVGKNSVSPSSPPGSSALQEALDTLLNEIDEETFGSKTGKHLDMARGTFFLEKITVQTNQECMEIVTSFYLHMQRYAREVPDMPDSEGLAAEADELFERTFARRGGTKAAFAEARTGVHGGLRLILDLLVNQVRMEEFAKYANFVFRRILGSLEYEDQVRLVELFMKRLAPHLPEEVLSSPPEQFVEHVEILLRAYVQAMGQVKQLLKSI